MAVILILAAAWLVRGGAAIAEVSRTGGGFVRMLLIAFVTSLPEPVTTGSAMRLGAHGMAVNKLLGSNVFNVSALASAHLVYTSGSSLGVIDSAFALAGLLAMLLTTLGLISNLAQVERRIWVIEVDAVLLTVGYVAGMYLLYPTGVDG